MGVAKIGTNIAENAAKNFVSKKIDMFNNKDMTVEGSEITLTNNEIEYVMKSNLWKSFKNKGVLLKGTTEKVINQKAGLLVPLIRAGLPLMTNLLTSRIKNVFLPLGITVAVSATGAAIQKKIFG